MAYRLLSFQELNGFGSDVDFLDLNHQVSTIYSVTCLRLPSPR